MRANFLLRFWGRDREIARAMIPAGVKTDTETDGATAVWFDTPEGRKAFAQMIDSATECLVMVTQDGYATHLTTVAVLTFEHAGVSYDAEVDFGFGYEPESVHYMFEEGNYSCDDNRSYIIQRNGHPDFPDMSCGDSIKLTRLEIERRHTARTTNGA